MDLKLFIIVAVIASIFCGLGIGYWMAWFKYSTPDYDDAFERESRKQANFEVWLNGGRKI